MCKGFKAFRVKGGLLKRFRVQGIFSVCSLGSANTSCDLVIFYMRFRV